MATLNDFRTSTYSGTSGNCVEVGHAGSAVAVRDTQDRDGGSLAFSASAWSKFIASL